MKRLALIISALLCCATAASAATYGTHHGRRSSPEGNDLTPDSVSAAALQGNVSDSALIVKAEVLLDRDGFSPGEIDGKDGDNFRKCAFRKNRTARVRTQ
jgi:hypothetical protein